MCVCHEVSSAHSGRNEMSCDLCSVEGKKSVVLLNPRSEMCDLTNGTAIVACELDNSLDDADGLLYMSGSDSFDGHPAGEYVCDPENVAAGDVRNMLSELALDDYIPFRLRDSSVDAVDKSCVVVE